MNIDRISEFLALLFLLGSFVLLALAVVEKIANLLGQTMRGVTFLPSDLALYATMLAVFAAALFLRSIRDELRKT